MVSTDALTHALCQNTYQRSLMDLLIKHEQFAIATESLVNIHSLTEHCRKNPNSVDNLRTLVADFNDLETQCGITESILLNADTENLAINVLKYVWDSLVRFITWIYDLIVDFFTKLFSIKDQTQSEVDKLVYHLSSHTIDAEEFGKARITALPYSKYVSFLELITKLSTSMPTLLSIFEAKGQIVDEDMIKTTIKDMIMNINFFTYTTDPKTGCAIISIAPSGFSSHATTNTTDTLGWNVYTVRAALDTIQQTLISIDRFKVDLKHVKQSFLSRLQQHVVNEDAHERYRYGILSLEQLIIGYGSMSIALARDVVAIAYIAKRYCK